MMDNWFRLSVTVPWSLLLSLDEFNFFSAHSGPHPHICWYDCAWRCPQYTRGGVTSMQWMTLLKASLHNPAYIPALLTSPAQPYLRPCSNMTWLIIRGWEGPGHNLFLHYRPQISPATRLPMTLFPLSLHLQVLPATLTTSQLRACVFMAKQLRRHHVLSWKCLSGPALMTYGLSKTAVK